MGDVVKMGDQMAVTSTTKHDYYVLLRTYYYYFYFYFYFYCYCYFYFYFYVYFYYG